MLGLSTDSVCLVPKPRPIVISEPITEPYDSQCTVTMMTEIRHAAGRSFFDLVSSVIDKTTLEIGLADITVMY